MIHGVVTAAREAVVRITVRGPTGKQRRLNALIDTGFDGWLSLPAETIDLLRLPWRRRARALLADGSETIFDIYEATILWDGRPRRIPIDEANTSPLVGMVLLEGYEFNAQVRVGGAIRLKRLPRASGGD